MAASVGSGVFAAIAILVIFSLVLLLLRRYLPLRTTEAYLLIPLFLALALPASVVLLVPIDLTSSTRQDVSVFGIWFPSRFMLVSWRITYWLIFVLTWIMLPLLGEYLDSGYREPKDRIRYSLRSNGRYQLMVLGSATVGLIYVIFQNGFDFTSLKALVMALAYVWGLALAIYLMGHGLVAIPRTLIRNANPGNRLRRLQRRAPRVYDRWIDATVSLESLESQVTQLQRRKSGVSRYLQEWIDELVDLTTCQDPESRVPFSTSLEESRPSVPAVITERYLADLTRRLKRARHQNARFSDTWDRLVMEAKDMQSIIDSSASKRLLFTDKAGFPSTSRNCSFVAPSMRYLLYVHVLPISRLGWAAVFSAASVCVVWSELVKSFAPNMSIVGLTTISVDHATGEVGAVGLWRQLMVSMWIVYMCCAALVGIQDAKVWGNRALVRRNTYPESACWYAGQVARLTVPLSYNFLTLLPRDVQHKTTFYKFLGQYIDLTPLGKGFDYFFPIFVLIPVVATLFNLYGKIKKVFDSDLLEEDDPDIGVSRWREGRDLIERDLNGPRSLGLSSRSARTVPDSASPTTPTGTARRPAPTMWVPPAETSRPSRTERPRQNPPRTAPQPLPEEEEENAFQSFVHRVKNTFETTGKPQWLQGGSSSFTRPRWLDTNNESDSQEDPAERGSSNDNSLGRWFGGRPAEGKLRL